MKSLFMILFTVFAVSAQSNLDSLITSGAQQVRHLKMMPLIPPDELFGRDTTRVILHPLNPSALNLVHTESTADLEKRVRDLEISVTKISVILENMQKVNEKHTDKFDTIMHFLEVIITAVAGIATALIGVYIKGRKKGGTT